MNNNFFYSNESGYENYITLTKLKKSKIYDIYLHNEDIHLNVEKNGNKYNICAGSLLATIKGYTFGNTYKVYKGTDKNHPILIRQNKNIYIPPVCITKNGINTFKSTDINKLDKFQLLEIHDKQVYLNEKVILTEYINDSDNQHFIFTHPLTIIQAISIIFFIN
jgi:hypothetical protein